MKHRLNTYSMSRPDAARILPAANAVFNRAQNLFALRFYLFAYFFTPFPIRKNCS